MNINRMETQTEVLDAASVAFEELLRKSQRLFEKKGRRTLVLLSGGSSLKVLDYVSDNYLSSHVTISVLDERFTADESVSNFSLFMKTSFYEDARNAGCKFIDTRVKSNDTSDDLERRLDKALAKWDEGNPEGLILATIGIGSDGHVAGIVPHTGSKSDFEELFNSKKRWVAAYDTGVKGESSSRVTTTLPFLRQIDSAVVYVVGEDKQNALERVVAEEGSLYETPARVLRRIENVQIFTDIKV